MFKTMFYLDIWRFRKTLLQTTWVSARTWSNASCIWESTRSPPGSISSLTSHIIASPIHVPQWKTSRFWSRKSRGIPGFGWFHMISIVFWFYFSIFVSNFKEINFWGLFDAFDGSLVDTICMILIPLVIVARLVPANVWFEAQTKLSVYHSNQQNTLKTGSDSWASFWCAYLSSTCFFGD